MDQTDKMTDDPTTPTRIVANITSPTPPGPTTMFKSPWTSAAPREIDEEDNTRGGSHQQPPPPKATATTATSQDTSPETVPRRRGLEWPQHRAHGDQKQAKKRP